MRRHDHRALPEVELHLGVDVVGYGRNTQFFPFGDYFQGAWAKFSPYAEYRPTSAWTVRLTASGMFGLRMRQVIDAYAGIKGASPLIYRDIQDLGTPATVQLRIRRQFF